MGKQESIGKKLFKWIKARKESSAREVIHDILTDHEEPVPSLNDEERLLMKNILKLRDQTVCDIMVPRVDIACVSKDISLESLVSFAAHKHYTRIVVYGKTLDEIQGFIHVKDLLQMLKKDSQTFVLKDILQKPLVIPQSVTVIDLLAMMRESYIPLALVIDEFGGVDGLVTAWDITKEIFGDVENAYPSQPFPLILPLSDGSYEADARLPIEEFTELFDLPLTAEQEDDGIDTLGGLIVSLAGRVPHRKEIITHPQGFEFIILEANPRRVERIQVIKKAQSPS